jgi:hypothetical protein
MNNDKDNHVIDATVIATRNNGTVINEIGNYYDVAVNDFDKLIFYNRNLYLDFRIAPLFIRIEHTSIPAGSKFESCGNLWNFNCVKYRDLIFL